MLKPISRTMFDKATRGARVVGRTSQGVTYECRCGAIVCEYHDGTDTVWAVAV